MELMFKEATQDDAEIIGLLVIKLTQEICERTHAQHFDIDLDGTIKRCRELLAAGHYAAIIGSRMNLLLRFQQSQRPLLYMLAGKSESFRSFTWRRSFVLRCGCNAN